MFSDNIGDAPGISFDAIYNSDVSEEDTFLTIILESEPVSSMSDSDINSIRVNDKENVSSMCNSDVSERVMVLKSIIEGSDLISIEGIGGENADICFKESLVTGIDDIEIISSSQMKEIEFYDDSGQRRTVAVIAVIPNENENIAADSIHSTINNSSKESNLSTVNMDAVDNMSKDTPKNTSSLKLEDINIGNNTVLEICKEKDSSTTTPSEDTHATNSNSVLNNYLDDILDLSITNSTTEHTDDVTSESNKLSTKEIKRKCNDHILDNEDNAVDLQNAFNVTNSESISNHQISKSFWYTRIQYKKSKKKKINLKMFPQFQF